MLVTIGLPFVNDRHTIIPAIQSIFAQTHTDWELIIMDDGSTDGTLDLVRMIHDPRVTVISDGKNLQLSARLNQMNMSARGKYIARMDSDDIMLPLRLQRQVQYMEANPSLDIVGTSAWRMDGNHKILRIQGDMPLSLNVLPRCSLYVHPTVMAKTEWFKQHKYDGKFVRAEDLEFWCRLVTRTRTRFGKLDEPLLFYRMNAISSLPKTLHSFRTHRKIVSLYGPELIGNLKATILQAELHFKSLFHQAASLLGVRDRIISRNAFDHHSPLVKQAQNTLEQIFITPVPGWESILNNRTNQVVTSTQHRTAA